MVSEIKIYRCIDRIGCFLKSRNNQYIRQKGYHNISKLWGQIHNHCGKEKRKISHCCQNPILEAPLESKDKKTLPFFYKGNKYTGKNCQS